MSESEINEKWTHRKIIEETIKSMGIHNEPSPETIGRLSTLEANYKNMDEKIDNILSKFDKLEGKIDCALEKKAGKWVEGVIKWVGICIGAGILGYLGTLIVKVIEL